MHFTCHPLFNLISAIFANVALRGHLNISPAQFRGRSCHQARRRAKLVKHGGAGGFAELIFAVAEVLGEPPAPSWF